MSRNKKFLLQAIAFCLLFLLTFFPIQEIFVRKSLVTPWDMTNKISGFYHEPENEFSVIYFGSSHAYASFSPLQIWKNTGVKSYVFATQKQPMWASVSYLKEALKTQSPKLAILECNMLYDDAEYMDEATNHSFMDDIPLSINKLELARISAEKQDQLPLVINFLMYHSRWSTLTKTDFTFRRSQVKDNSKGFVILPPKFGGPEIVHPDLSNAHDSLPISEKNEHYLREFIEICQQNDIDLWLVKSPCNIWPDHYRKILSAKEIAAEYDVRFNDFNSAESYEAIGITARDHFFDERHMDITGGTLFTDYFCQLLQEYYPDLPTQPDDANWQDAYETYQKDVEFAIAHPVKAESILAAEDRDE